MTITHIYKLLICFVGMLFINQCFGFADCEENHLVISNKLGKWVVVEQLQRDHQNNVKDFRLEPLEVLEITAQHLKFEVHNAYSATICIVEVDTHCDVSPQVHKLNILFGDSCHETSGVEGDYNLEISPHA